MNLRDPELEPSRFAAVGCAGGGLVERPRLLAPRARERLEPLPRLRRAGGGAIERRRLDEGVHREVVRERLVDEGGAERGVPRRERLRVAAGGPRGVEHPLGLPEPAQRREARQRPRPGLLQRRIEPAGARVQEGSTISAAELLLVHDPEAEGGAGRLARVLLRRRLAVDGGREGGPVLALLEDLDHRAERLGVGRIGAQELPVELLRAGDVPEPRVREVRGPGEQRGARAANEACPPLVERDEVLPTGGGLVERFERLEGAGIPGRGLEGLEVGADLLVQGGCAQVGIALGREAARKSAAAPGV